MADLVQNSRLREVTAFMKPLEIPLYRSLWVANSISNLGTWMHTVGAAWLMTSLSNSPLMVALVQTASTLPIFLVAIPAGVLADTLDRPRFLFYVQMFMAFAAALLGVVTLMGWISPWTLLFFTFLLGAGNAMNLPAWQAAVSGLVPDAELQAAASLNNMSFSLGRAVGPAIGGFLIGIAGTASVFLINALSFTWILRVFYWWQKQSDGVPRERQRFSDSLSEGFHHTFASRRFRILTIRSASFFFCSTALWSFLPSIARDQLHVGPEGFGVLMAGLGLGSSLIPVFLPYLRGRWTSHEVVSRFSLAFLFAQAALAGITHVWGLFPFMVLGGCAWGAVVSEFNSSAQRTFPLPLRSRGLSYYYVSLFGSAAIGSAVWGQLADWTSTPIALTAACGGIVLSLFIGRRFPIEA